jgi:hypothetical protein
MFSGHQLPRSLEQDFRGAPTCRRVVGPSRRSRCQ